MTIVVILGNRLNNDASMSKELYERLDLGIETFYKVNADYLCVTGGMANFIARTTEASQMYSYLIEHDFDEEKNILEDKSLTTRGNARYLKRILKDVQIDKLYLVSSKYHFFRTKYPTCQVQFRKYFKNVEIINTYKDEQ